MVEQKETGSKEKETRSKRENRKTATGGVAEGTSVGATGEKTE